MDHSTPFKTVKPVIPVVIPLPLPPQQSRKRISATADDFVPRSAQQNASLSSRALPIGPKSQGVQRRPQQMPDNNYGMSARPSAVHGYNSLQPFPPGFSEYAPLPDAPTQRNLPEQIMPRLNLDNVMRQHKRQEDANKAQYDREVKELNKKFENLESGTRMLQDQKDQQDVDLIELRTAYDCLLQQTMFWYQGQYAGVTGNTSDNNQISGTSSTTQIEEEEQQVQSSRQKELELEEANEQHQFLLRKLASKAYKLKIAEDRIVSLEQGLGVAERTPPSTPDLKHKGPEPDEVGLKNQFDTICAMYVRVATTFAESEDIQHRRTNDDLRYKLTEATEQFKKERENNTTLREQLDAAEKVIRELRQQKNSSENDCPEDSIKESSCKIDDAMEKMKLRIKAGNAQARIREADGKSKENTSNSAKDTQQNATSSRTVVNSGMGQRMGSFSHPSSFFRRRIYSPIRDERSWRKVNHVFAQAADSSGASGF